MSGASLSLRVCIRRRKREREMSKADFRSVRVLNIFRGPAISVDESAVNSPHFSHPGATTQSHKDPCRSVI